MKKILSPRQAIKQSNALKKQHKRMVLVGGCFDILHIGHVLFLEKAKEKGDILFVWVEHDQVIKQRKGDTRPIHTQKDRAKVLAALACVNYVIMIPPLTTNQEYDTLVMKLKPAIIAATKGDPERIHKKRSAKLVGAEVVYVTRKLSNTSTSRVARLVAQEE